KNIIAIAAGVVEGLGLGHNSLAALITRGLAEITRLSCAAGARRETLSGLSGLGDLVLTCTANLSRNRYVGVELARGRTPQEIVERFDEIVRQADAPERRARAVDVETMDALEELLISADVGVAATDRIIASVRQRERNGASVRDLVKEEIRGIFSAVDRPVT